MRINISIDPPTKELIDKSAESLNISSSAFIRLAVHQYSQSTTAQKVYTIPVEGLKVESLATSLTPPPKENSIEKLPGYIDHNKFGHKEPGMIQNNQVVPVRGMNPEATPDNWEKGDYSEKSIERD